MKKGLLGFVGLLVGVMFVLGIVSLPASAVAPPAPINKIFPDPVLAQTIASKLGKSTTAVVTIQKLETITKLEKIGGGIKYSYGIQQPYELMGLEYCSNLEEINFEGNKIESLNHIKNLVNLKKINLKYNKFYTLQALSKLTSLQEVNLSFRLQTYNTLDLSPLYGAVGLNYLDASQNKLAIKDISKLQKLETLKLNNTTVSVADLSEISKIGGNLRILELGKCSKIDDISPLANLDGLEELNLCGGDQYTYKYSPGKISNIEALKDMDTLEKLDLSYNQIKDISPLMNLENLTELKLKGNPIDPNDPNLLTLKGKGIVKDL